MNVIKPSNEENKSLTVTEGFMRACDLLRSGDIVAIPTETVYGLAADSSDDKAVAKIYRAKGRPSFNPLIVHVTDVLQAQKLVQWNDRAEKLARSFWPGALTMVIEAKPDNGIASSVCAGLPTLALRCPAHPIMREILIKTGLNLAAPSANKSGGLSSTCAEHVRQSFSDNVPFIIDGGPCSSGLESTIIALRSNGWQILRPGPITEEMIEYCLDEAELMLQEKDQKIEAPGQLTSHYAPIKELRLNVDKPKDNEYYIGLGDMICDLNLSPIADMEDAASRLFAALHIADQSQALSIAIAPIENIGIGIAINDRLKRAAVKR